MALKTVCERNLFCGGSRPPYRPPLPPGPCCSVSASYRLAHTGRTSTVKTIKTKFIRDFCCVFGLQCSVCMNVCLIELWWIVLRILEVRCFVIGMVVLSLKIFTLCIYRTRLFHVPNILRTHSIGKYVCCKEFLEYFALYFL